MTELNTGKHDRGVDNQKREKRECRSSQWRTSESAIAIGGVGSVDHSSITTSRTRYKRKRSVGGRPMNRSRFENIVIVTVADMAKVGLSVMTH